MVGLLSMIIAKIGQFFFFFFFIVTESDELCRLLSESSEQGRRFFSLFHSLVERVDGSGARIKVSIINFGLDLGSESENSGDAEIVL